MEKYNEKLDLEETLLTDNTEHSNKNNNKKLKTILILFLTLLVLAVNFKSSLLRSVTSHEHHLGDLSRGSWRDRRSIRNYYSYFKSTLTPTSKSCHKPRKEQALEALFLSIPTTESAKEASHSLVSFMISRPSLTRRLTPLFDLFLSFFPRVFTIN